MEIKKTLLWVVFSVSGIMLFNNWQIAHGNKPLPFLAPPPPASESTNQGTVKDVSGTAQLPNTAGLNQKQEIVPSESAKISPDQGIVTTTRLQNEVLDLEISAKGGTIIKSSLKKHLDKGNTGDPVVLMENKNGHIYIARNGLISQGLDVPNHNDIFTQKLSTDGHSLVQVAEKSGVLYEKTYTLKPNSYVLEVKHTVTNKNPNPISSTIYSELVRDGTSISESQFYSTFTGPAIFTDKEKFKEVSFKDIENKKVTVPAPLGTDEPGWIAMVQHYFASAWIPEINTKREFYFDNLDKNLYRVGMTSSLEMIAPGTAQTQTVKLFIGPDDETILRPISPGFELIKDYGRLTIIAKPIFWFLTQIHSVVGNWGWAIIILTVLIKLAFFPLSAASYKSMARMKEVQPRLVQMKEQYKSDPQRLNKEMMEMYKKEKINPLGGCLPVVIQIPVFISLYWVLLLSVEMRGAPWTLWIHDLSAPDTSLSGLVGLSIPIGILPILMAISMFVQTKLNPAPPDPVQAKVMLFMPLAFSLMFFFFPSGLVLYYIVNNLLSIAQQWQINRLYRVKNQA
ncbi:membrane protein insertase YidC [Polynucleobacter rarus]|uniref:membrane protein insertase YidC n=1 Tax=Polynucleobacter rarus TaxID=556055 RepID=UPI000D3E2FB5|nr:membrane protein insertase YidC [Polynucleobacter rarus]